MATWGGKRNGAGRKKTAACKHDPVHRARPALASRHPVHVVLRLDRHNRWRLRCGPVYRALRRVLARFRRSDFRVCHVSIQHNHIHLLVEASDQRALTLGMQSFTIRAARAINGALKRGGKLFPHRYHATQITSARQARNAVSYVLNNWRRHLEDVRDPRAWRAQLDPYSSGVSFAGWRGSPRWKLPDGYDPLPISQPTTALLVSVRSLDPYHCPGPL